MTKQELTQTRVQLYKATPLKLQLVEELANAIKHCSNGVETNGIDFRDTKLKLNGISVRLLEIDPQELGNVLVHWYPKFDTSTTSDPFCSAYILTPKELRKLIKTITNIKDFYNSHLNK